MTNVVFLCPVLCRVPLAARRSSAMCHFRRDLHDLQDLHDLHDHDRREQALYPEPFTNY
jgi:hypothetical protein